MFTCMYMYSPVSVDVGYVGLRMCVYG